MSHAARGVLEALGERIAKVLTIPTIGIGGGPYCSCQIPILYDMLGIYPGKQMRFFWTICRKKIELKWHSTRCHWRSGCADSLLISYGMSPSATKVNRAVVTACGSVKLRISIKREKREDIERVILPAQPSGRYSDGACKIGWQRNLRYPRAISSWISRVPMLSTFCSGHHA